MATHVQDSSLASSLARLQEQVQNNSPLSANATGLELPGFQNPHTGEGMQRTQEQVPLVPREHAAPVAQEQSSEQAPYVAGYTIGAGEAGAGMGHVHTPPLQQEQQQALTVERAKEQEMQQKLQQPFVLQQLPYQQVQEQQYLQLREQEREGILGGAVGGREHHVPHVAELHQEAGGPRMEPTATPTDHTGVQKSNIVAALQDAVKHTAGAGIGGAL